MEQTGRDYETEDGKQQEFEHMNKGNSGYYSEETRDYEKQLYYEQHGYSSDETMDDNEQEQEEEHDEEQEQEYAEEQEQEQEQQQEEEQGREQGLATSSGNGMY